ncbi:hypothetical protein AGDE_14692 [Angomonas deanei]|uniref:Uncharacterized protein n=1 Tax=Angomonas deanei TaxID=59799 RepID=A0A7G2CE47_9TRYP|nr:hypothetical protein AGDE_14692 [Angomonas deanei]CAD2217769.1 hypothetical protein, conserved [Angomonas deanei]|eukprot:EPY20413.1 hypothetical protein AGDE_14692 [Angomonas deanei]
MLEEKTRQEAALMHLAKPPKRQKTAEVEKKAEKPEKSAPTKGKRKEQPPLPKRGGRPAHTNDDDVSEDELVQDNMVQRQKLRQTRQPVESSDEDSATEGELVIENNPSTFRKTAAPARPTAGEDDTWDEATLERRIASIVQLYDPVTVATVAKKLSGVGYSDPDMTGTVEAVLRKFQQRQLLFFDNGIAYLL